jgi:uncharacterized protein
MPFCSQRCRTIDLGRWADERYAMPIDPDDDAGEGDAGEEDVSQ